MKYVRIFLVSLCFIFLFVGCSSNNDGKIDLFDGGCIFKSKPTAIVNPEIGKGFKDKKIVKPAKVFNKKTPKVYCTYYIENGKKGTKIKGEWWQKSKNKKIFESTVTIRKDENFGLFTLSKPKGGWQPGRYNLLIYVGGRDTPDVIIDFVVK